MAFPLIAAGCGDDDEADTTAAPTTGAAGGGGETVDISETDFKITPDQVDVKPGSVTFAVSNDGETVHNLEIEGSGVEEELPSDLQPGQSGDLEVELQPGTYEMYCPVSNHLELGMEGEVTVK
jgi:uncharacterized cupredoxin-like copper-binding protein